MVEYTASGWMPVPDMPKAASSVTAVAMDGKILVVGGYDSKSVYLSTVLEYNLGDCTWNALPSLLTARCMCAVTVLGADVVVMGGWGFDATTQEVQGPIALVERYNRRLQCWEAMPSLTTGSMFRSEAVVVPYRLWRTLSSKKDF